MKLKIGLLILVLVFISIGCNQKVKNKGKLIYKSPNALKGKWQQKDYPDNSKLKIITPKNLAKMKKNLRNIDGLSLDGGLAVYLTLGECATGGYDIQVREVRKDNQILIVTLEMVGPAPDQAVTQVITYPYDVVTLSASEVQDVQKVLFYSVAGDKIKEEEIDY